MGENSKLQGITNLGIPLSAQSLVYGSKKNADARRIISPKDFFWDQLVLYMGSAILALTILDISVEFLRGSRGVVCFTPYLDGNFTRDQATFVNGYCSQSLPFSEFYPVYVIVQGLLLLAPHYLWESFFQGYFDDFFGLVRELDRLRDPKTGDYSETNVNIVGKLEAEFSSHTRRIFRFYAGKLVLQVLIGLASIGISEVIFRDFSASFNCPRDVFPPEWPLDTTVTCSFSSLRILSVIRYVDYILISVAVLASFYGLLWCLLRHSTELGFETISQFCFSSGLTPDSYQPPTIFGQNVRSSLRERVSACFKPRIMNDLDFLILRLFRSDAGVGLVFKDIQIQRRLKYLLDKDHELLSILIDAQQDEHYSKDIAGGDRKNDIYDFFWKAGFDKDIEPLRQFLDKIKGNPEHGSDFAKFFYHRTEKISRQAVEIFPGIRNVFYGFTLLAKDNARALDVSFGAGGGFNLELARAFKWVNSINFHPFYRNFEEICSKKTFVSNFSTIKVLEDIYTRHNSEVLKFTEAMIGDFRNLVSGFKHSINVGQTSNEQLNEDRNPLADYEEESLQQMSVNDSTSRRSLSNAGIHTDLAGSVLERSRRDSHATLSISEVQAHRRRVNFIVVGPITDPAKLITANILMERAHTPDVPYFDEDAILLSVRPLQIEGVDVSSIFHKYIPPKGLFEEYDVKKALKNSGLKHQEWKEFIRDWDKLKEHVGNLSGVYVKCGATHTVFEFETYRYHRGGPGKARTDIKPGEEGDTSFSSARQSTSTLLHPAAFSNSTGPQPSPSIAFPQLVVEDVC